MPALTPRQFWVLAALTLVWGLNWPVMKAGVSGLPAEPSAFPPLTFRALSMWLGLPVLGLALLLLKVPFAMPRRHWHRATPWSPPTWDIAAAMQPMPRSDSIRRHASTGATAPWTR